MPHLKGLNLFVREGELCEKPAHAVQSNVAAAVCREFGRAVEGKAVTITRANFDGLVVLCDEFGFHGLDDAIAIFRVQCQSARSSRRQRMEARMDEFAATPCALRMVLGSLEREREDTLGLTNRHAARM